MCYFTPNIAEISVLMQIGHLKKKVSSSAGFTLLELIVVVAVLGILVAIAVQQFQLHRARAIDAAMRSDLKNAASGHGELLWRVSLVSGDRIGDFTGRL